LRRFAEMKLSVFKMERYFDKYEFSAPHLFCCSDCESFEVQELFNKKEFEELKKLRLGYSESEGNPELRNEVSQLFKRVKADDILICVPEEGIFVLMNVLLEKGDSVIVQTPCYQSLFEVANSIGCKVIKWKPTAKEDKWAWDLEFLKQQIKKKVKLVVVTCPHNPTGQLFSHEEYDEIMRLALLRSIMPTCFLMRCSDCSNTTGEIDCPVAPMFMRSVFLFLECQRASGCQA
jgi:hypothetical protein